MATTTAGAFTLVNKSVVPKFDQKGFAVYTSAETAVLANATDNAVSLPLTSATTPLYNGLNGNKVMMGVQVTTAFSDVAGEVILQGSMDGSNWVNISTIIADSTPNVTGVKLALADLTSVKVPMYRLNFNSAGNSVGTSGKLKFLFSVPKD